MQTLAFEIVAAEIFLPTVDFRHRLCDGKLLLENLFCLSIEKRLWEAGGVRMGIFILLTTYCFKAKELVEKVTLRGRNDLGKW